MTTLLWHVSQQLPFPRTGHGKQPLFFSIRSSHIPHFIFTLFLHIMFLPHSPLFKRQHAAESKGRDKPSFTRSIIYQIRGPPSILTNSVSLFPSLHFFSFFLISLHFQIFNSRSLYYYFIGFLQRHPLAAISSAKGNAIGYMRLLISRSRLALSGTSGQRRSVFRSFLLGSHTST